jgi:flagellar basal-body rod protein FlgB
MDTIPHMDIVEKTLEISALKRKTIADNIANYNTPEFKASRLKFDEAWFTGETAALKTTNSKHITSAEFSADETGAVVEKDNGSKVREDGNNVNLNFEMVEMIKNNYVFGLGVKAINKEFSMVKTAIGKA